LFQNLIPAEINPVIALCCMYLGGFICAVPFYFKTKKKYKKNKKSLGPRALLFGITNILIDLGFFLAFKSGWSVGYFNITTNICILIVLTITSVIFYKEKMSMLNFFGIIVSIIGLSILNL
jgi:uncharacterized membrane protein